MKVAVIGAGLAGLTVARGCHSLGFEVDVFDKAGGLGGRLAHKRLPWAAPDMGAQYFTAHDRQFRREVELWTRLGVVRRWAFEPSVVEQGHLKPSPDTTERFIGNPTMNQIAHEVAVGLPIHLHRRVGAVVRTHTRNPALPQWRLLFETGETGGKVIESGGYDWLVVSLPAGQARALLEHSPLAGAIAEPLMEPCWAVALATRGKVASAIQGIFGDHTVSWVSRQTTRAHGTGLPQTAAFDDLWVAHFAAQWTRNHGADAEAIAPVAHDWLGRVLRTPLELVHSHTHYWRYARGHQDSPGGQRFLVDPGERVAVVGDWLAGGRVEGAWLSAQALVDQVLSAEAGANAIQAVASKPD